MTPDITFSNIITLAVLLVSCFNAYQHLSGQNKILKLQLWITQNFVSKKDCDGRHVRNGNGNGGGYGEPS